MKIKTIVILVFLILFIATVLTLIFTGKTLFTLKYIDIKKDFDLNEEKLIEYLELYPLRPLWSYNAKELKEKLSHQFYLSSFNVLKRYPNTLLIKLKIRSPLLKIAGFDGKIYVVDGDGYIFREAWNKDENIPLVLLRVNSKVKPGTKISGVYENLIGILRELKKSRVEIYNAISQVEVNNSKKYGMDYIVKFKTYDKFVYLKNIIDVDSIIRGLSCVLFVNNKNYDYNRLFYNENGFALKNY